MSHGDEKRFEEFFQEGKYIAFKNHLYNYVLRKGAIESILAKEDIRLVLEVGSGISPVMTQTPHIVYSELSHRALRILKAFHGKGHYVVADSTRLPFADGAFSHAISSEVFEHIEDDQGAMNELARAVETEGKLIVTVPHRRMYFANDDRFVKHFRRYEIDELQGKLQQAGAEPLTVRKVLGPLEKITMMITCFAVAQVKGFKNTTTRETRPSALTTILVPLFKWANCAYAALARLDAAIMPRALAAVILVTARKKPTP
jgi:SAM-dependent methyltransferase